MENKELTSYILQSIQQEKAEHITINDDSFIVQLSEHNSRGFWKRGARLVGLVLTCVVVIAFIIYSAVFYCQNVLFYSGELNVNQFGAFTPKKSYSSEYAMYLFNSKEQWINSGIQVLKGDRLFIGASGAYHTNYRKLVDAARNNTLADTFWIDRDTTALRWIYTSHSGNHACPDAINRKYTGTYSENGQPFMFGDILFQVVPEYQVSNAGYDEDMARIYKIPSPTEGAYRPIEIRQNGTLAFMVNDRKPANNIGQILVATEIFRHSDSFCGTTWKKIFFRWLDLPYYYYNLLRHENRHFVAVFVYWLSASLELAFFCLLAFFLPICFYYSAYLVGHPKKEYNRLKNKTKELYLRCLSYQNKH